jgi:long-chain acyl-CoA synthetase
MTWAEYAREVERVAGGLATLGVQHGDRVMFLARNTPKLAIAETAALHLGAASVIATPPRPQGFSRICSGTAIRASWSPTQR